jgi:hypothetical protein
MLTRLPAATAVLSLLFFGPFSVAQTPSQTAPAQTPAAPATPPAVYVPTSLTPEPGLARTPDGRPDLQGAVWAANFFPVFESTPMSAALTVPEPEAKKMVEMMIAGFKKSVGAALELDPEAEDLLTNVDGLPLVRGERRTRMVVLPADGKVPMKPEVRKDISSSNPMSIGALDNPEQRPINERCLALNARPPMATPIAYVRFQFIQTPTHVVIHSEDGDESRIIPYASEHAAAITPNWLGDAIARWEGETLVVETIRAPRQGRIRGFNNFVVTPDSKVIERFTRLSNTELLYQFTVEDPALYTAPWLAEYSLYRADSRMFPGNCHGSNYSLPNILQGARVADAASARSVVEKK